jgi:signal transduction histidine kinase
MASLGILSSGISHEFNNPLNFILHGVHLLDKSIRKESQIDQRNYDEFFEIIYSGIDRVTRIVSSLNEFSNSSAEQADCDLHQIIDRSFIYVSGKDLNHVNLSHKLEAQRATVFGNKSKLHQLIVNLLSNAIDAVQARGTVLIRTTSTENQLKIIIEDDGVGIPGEIQSKVFDPFFSTKDPGKGTGLGLSIAYSIVEEHKGKISLNSETGKGTIVTVRLPLSS